MTKWKRKRKMKRMRNSKRKMKRKKKTKILFPLSWLFDIVNVISCPLPLSHSVLTSYFITLVSSLLLACSLLYCLFLFCFALVIDLCILVWFGYLLFAMVFLINLRLVTIVFFLAWLSIGINVIRHITFDSLEGPKHAFAVR